MGIDIDAAEIVRRLVAWGQGRMDERLLWMFARKCGDCMDWAIDIAGKHDTNVTLWEGYYKGPTYTEFPVTHFFYNKNINLDYTYGNSEGIGNVALMLCFEEELKKAGVTLMYRTLPFSSFRTRTSALPVLSPADRITTHRSMPQKASLLQPAATAPMKK